jgi:hypothetical protein
VLKRVRAVKELRGVVRSGVPRQAVGEGSIPANAVAAGVLQDSGDPA